MEFWIPVQGLQKIFDLERMALGPVCLGKHVINDIKTIFVQKIERLQQESILSGLGIREDEVETRPIRRQVHDNAISVLANDL